MSIAELIKKLEALTGPDRGADEAILEAAGGKKRLGDWWIGHSFIGRHPDRYTASIDAAVALAERALPGVELELTNLYNVARATLHHETGPFYGSSAINSLPIAICLAVLRALPSGEQP